MGEHVIVRWTALSHNAWEAECRCGETRVGLDREQAERRMLMHHNAETIGRAGLAQARAALKKGE